MPDRPSDGDSYFDYTRFSEMDEGTADWSDISDAIEASQSGEAGRIRDQLIHLEQELEDREGIHEDLVDNLSWKIETYESELQQMENLFLGDQEKRQRMRDQIQYFRKELRSEQHKFWSDRQRLESERRKLLRELDEIESIDLLEMM